MSSLDDLFAHIHTQPRLNVLHAELGDNPATHRWRAGWTAGEHDKTDIELRPVRVVKPTPAGAWIDPDAWWDGSSWCYVGSKRWVANDSGSAWAKPTQEAALQSLAIRLDRWAIQMANQLTQLRSAIATAEELLPQYGSWPVSARLRLPRDQLDPAVIEAWLKRKYVQEADARQKEMGLSYTNAETSDLAREIARFYRSGL